MEATRKSIFIILLCSLSALTACGGGGGSAPVPTPTYTISGTIFADAGNVVDSDINDTLGPEPVDNSSYDAAQTITAPAVVGGYVNTAGEGPGGRSFEDGDVSDFYDVDLLAGDIVRLALPDDTTGSENVDLFLYDQSDPPVEIDSLTDVTRTQSLSLSADGSYFIEIRAVSGAASYRLIVGTPSATAQTNPAEMSAEFVPGEVLVKLKVQKGRTKGHAMADVAQRLGLRRMGSRPQGWMRLGVDDVQTAFDRLHIPKTRSAAHRLVGVSRKRQARHDTIEIIRALRDHPDVAAAEPNYIRRAFFEPDDSLYPLQWNLDLINLPSAWDTTQGDAGVIVAVLDSGVLGTHPDFVGKLTDGYDFIDDDADPTDPGGGSAFHGTHVAGIVGAAFDNAIGVAGVGGDTLIMPVRVLDTDGTGTDADIADAIHWAAGIDITDDQGAVIVPGANPPADIINLSLGGAVSSGRLLEAVQDAHNAGLILVAAAGNEAIDAGTTYPAAYSEVISVSAVAADSLLAPYSNFGPSIDVAAPGGNVNTDIQPDGYVDGVLSTVATGTGNSAVPTYTYYQGTSMAAPHVSAVAALMKAVQPAMTPGDFEAYLMGGSLTADLGADGKDNIYGYGLIDAHQAVLTAEAGTPPTVLAVSPGSLRLGATTQTAQLFVRQVGTDTLELTSVADDAAWLTVGPTSGTEGELGQYTMTVDRSGLSGGLHTGSISLTYTVEAVEQTPVVVPVTIQVLPDSTADTSTQYLSLFNSTTLLSVAQLVLTSTNGVYSFSFTDVEPGSYILITGSDLNNDFRLTDQGEAVGAYPSVEEVGVVNVQADVSGLQFVAGFNQWPFLLPVQATMNASGLK